MSFSLLDWKYPITRTVQASGGGQFDPANPGTRLAATAPATTTIKGHVAFNSPGMVNDYAHDPSGQQDEGDAYLWTSTALSIGDSIAVALDAASAETLEYKVTGVGFAPGFIPGGRRQYVLELKEEPSAFR